jgi:hypothetical protein
LFASDIQAETSANLGPVVKRDDIRSTKGPFYALPSYRVVYPTVVIAALARLYAEYNATFTSLLEKNREWDTDYRHCHLAGGRVANFAVQIDMVGLSQVFIDSVAKQSVESVTEILRGHIFEFENSLAMYSLLQGIFSSPGGHSRFCRKFRSSLDNIRNRFDRPIALLAVTDQKYRAMLETEFGWKEGDSLPSDAEIETLTGFNTLLGPDEFARHVRENDGDCRYLLYARTSDPVAKLKNPRLEVHHPLLGNPELRHVIKANSLTLNVDAPGMPAAHRINDTKEYMPQMGMAYPVNHEQDLFSDGVLEFIRRTARPYAEYTGTERLNSQFAAWLRSREIDPGLVAAGSRKLRAKPLRGSYGCYGHVKGSASSGDFRANLRRNLERRGSYIVQPELPFSVITNTADGQQFAFIDRVFFSITGEQPEFIGGFRDMIPLDSFEVARGRIHGNADAVWAEITD